LGDIEEEFKGAQKDERENIEEQKVQVKGKTIGRKTYPDGSTYHGEWFKDIRHGNGVHIGADNEFKYEG
jgi:hypothetical protein